MNIPFKTADILIPQEKYLEKWSVVACDQYTSEPAYWERVEKTVGDAPSSFKMIFPEIYLENDGKEERIKNINNSMSTYLNGDVFNKYENALIYVKRTVNSGKIRKGIIGAVDLEAYNYNKGSKSLIRATEGTVLERIPPRVQVRINAPAEMPHIMLLIDDYKKNVIESIDETKLKKVYDFDLMENGGHIEGYLIENPEEIISALTSLSDGLNPENPLLFAVGDGNHSLATAKECWERKKQNLSDCEKETHPARFALTEIVNIHDEALEFEPIHRIVFDVDSEKLLKEFSEYYEISETEGVQKVVCVLKGENKDLYIKNPKSNLTVGSLQIFLDEYINKNGGKIDYIHGENVVSDLSAKENSIGFLLPAMDKSDLFKTVILDGALPRKTFSMGEANEKRFYLEVRAI